MSIKKVLLTLSLVLSIALAYSQKGKFCGFDTIYKDLITHSNFTQSQIEFNRMVKKHAHNKSNEIVTIPVIVHVLYKNNAENISNAQILSQIDVLNEDYRKLNADTTNVLVEHNKADLRIQFELATTDPNGDVFCGIIRVNTNVDNICDPFNGMYAQISPAIDRDHYLNMWVCDVGNSIAGFAYPPNSPGISKEEDGVVIDYTNFGTIGTVIPPYDKGRTATHEIGHWFNLFHPWANNNGNCNGDDQVDDTPKQDGAVLGDYNNCSEITTSCGSKDMLSNFMQWVDDQCMGNFTNGQKVRFRAALNMGRPGLISSNGLDSNVVFDTICPDVVIIDPPSQNPLILENLYPSPNQGIFKLKFTRDINPNSLEVRLKNIEGANVPFNQSQEDECLIIEILRNQNGLYFVEILNADHKIIRKVIVNR